VAREGQHPRAYEVAGALIKNVADTVDKLQDLQKKLTRLKRTTKNGKCQHIKNALFVGSTAELQKMLKGTNESIKSAEVTPKKDDIED
jgi:tetrahydrodipicolinate N-succinyltransferase